MRWKLIAAGLGFAALWIANSAMSVVPGSAAARAQPWIGYAFLALAGGCLACAVFERRPR